jgi:amino acid transporter
MNDPNRPQLRRSLGFWALVFYGVGDILGAGIYAMVGKVAGVAGSASWAAFAVALVVAGLTAVTYAELGGRFPRSAGESFFTEQAFGRPGLSLVVGWVVLCSGILSLATVSVAFGGYMSGLVPGVPPWITVVGILLLLSAINFRGMRESSSTNIIATMVELSGLLIVIVAGALFLGDDDGVTGWVSASPEYVELVDE